MKTYKPVKEVIEGKDIYSHNRVNLCMHFDYYERTLITGKVTNLDDECIENAGVEIVLLDKYTHNEIYLGVVFTDKNGVYAFSVSTNGDYDYKLNVYAPLPN